MSAERVDVVADLRGVVRIAKAASIGVTGNGPRIERAEAALALVSELIEASKKARDGYRSTLRLMGCDEFFIDAQTAELDTILSSIQGKP